jgi:hypothetical protein
VQRRFLFVILPEKTPVASLNGPLGNLDAVNGAFQIAGVAGTPIGCRNGSWAGLRWTGAPFRYGCGAAGFVLEGFVHIRRLIGLWLRRQPIGATE